ncbi:MAG: helix-turn-helix transcriptional regulator [Chloroflexi bacterium]|nr:helix-turn-helix transcriptional regulator [Chloroflexota bacterium]MBK8935198.1 helix-turn-helix transcriptional regulator [Chloroflexota bacterium]MBP6803087.1 helix-turn-helix transcriptional regulator [Chloroflexota bacterium]MBP7591687.1 helix-turn-helix transcriptional regulator [Chloroflexota bacterium]
MMISTCRSPFCALTPRQTELLELLSASPSATSRELAQRMHVSERTVKKHFYGIYRTLGVQNRVECLALLYRKGPGNVQAT